MGFQEERFRFLYKRYMPLLRMIAVGRGIPGDELEDLLHDTYAAYYRNYPLTWEDPVICAYLAAILRNRCVDYHRSQRNRLVEYADPHWSGREGTSCFFCRDPLDIILERRDYQEIAEALRSMREDWAAVFWLYLIEEKPMKEVSRVLGVSEAACRMRLMRGRRYLRKRVGYPGKRA